LINNKIYSINGVRYTRQKILERGDKFIFPAYFADLGAEVVTWPMPVKTLDLRRPISQTDGLFTIKMTALPERLA